MIGGWLTRYLDRRRRESNLMWLWPSVKAVSPSLDFARTYIAWHCSLDPAWSDVSHDELIDIIDALT